MAGTQAVVMQLVLIPDQVMWMLSVISRQKVRPQAVAQAAKQDQELRDCLSCSSRLRGCCSKAILKQPRYMLLIRGAGYW